MAGNIIYSGSPGGSIWTKWDLHVHTPASAEQYYGDGEDPDLWERYIKALASLPREIRALGINDYYTLEGYKRVKAAQAAGKLPNLDLILPVVEFRLNMLVGNEDTRKINYHVVFSNQLRPEDIELFFLNKLTMEVHLTEGQPPFRGGCCSRAELIRLGEAAMAAAPAAKRGTMPSALKVGHNYAAVELGDIETLLAHDVFKGKYLTAIGRSEWDGMRWAAAPQKRDLANRVQFLFTAAPSHDAYTKARNKLREDGVNCRLLDASDAHYFAESVQQNRLGQTACWLKADRTFEGLRRAIDCFEERVFVGEMPTRLVHLNRQKTKHIQRVTITKNAGSTLEEKWFATDLELNPGLVAIVGNQGSGKTALTDILALCGNTHVDGFNFLTPQKFCDKKKKAAEFTAEIIWGDGERVSRGLDAKPDRTQAERVRYVPQGFFESATNEKSIAEQGEFYTEIKKAIYSHVGAEDRQGCDTLDELVELHTSAAQQGLTMLRQQLSELNRKIWQLEAATLPEETQKVRGLIKQKRGEIEALQASPPATVNEPADAAEANSAIDGLRVKKQELEEQLSRAQGERGRFKRQRIGLKQERESIENEVTRFRVTLDEIQKRLDEDEVTVSVAECVQVSVELTPFEEALKKLDQKIEGVDALCDETRDGSVAAQIVAAQKDIDERMSKLQSADNAYQVYRAEVSKWEAAVKALRGDQENGAPESLAGLERRLKDLEEEKPRELEALREARRMKCKEIHAALAKLAEVYAKLTKDVQEHIAADAFTRDHYQLRFEVKLAEHGLADRFFSYIPQNTGAFAGADGGKQKLAEALVAADLETPEGAVEFAEQMVELLSASHKPIPLKRGTSAEGLYDLLFGLTYLAPTFALSLNEKPLNQLSPGERGILLLVFYLLVDRSEEPLIIDQPEGNLNNQSIYESLVPVFRAAKERRQIVMVTHNPNLAVVCDAEQIIHCTRDQNDGNRVDYAGGGLENPRFSRVTLDVLDGTGPAFKVRQATYANCG